MVPLRAAAPQLVARESSSCVQAWEGMDAVEEVGRAPRFVDGGHDPTGEEGRRFVLFVRRQQKRGGGFGWCWRTPSVS